MMYTMASNFAFLWQVDYLVVLLLLHNTGTQKSREKGHNNNTTTRYEQQQQEQQRSFWHGILHYWDAVHVASRL